MFKNALGVLCVAGCLGACAHHGTSVAEREQRSEATLRMNDDTASARVASNDEAAPYGTVSDDTARDETMRGMSGDTVSGDDVAVTMPERRERPSRFASTGEMIPGGAATPKAADDTGLNTRDRSDQTVTPMDQGNSSADTDLTARIRKAIMADDALSFDAKNSKIITQNGHVTLRGPVKSMQEKQAIGRAASNLAGAGHVTNDLEVAR
jgi:hyperosmotically inducible periplasmic protein